MGIFSVPLPRKRERGRKKTGAAETTNYSIQALGTRTAGDIEKGREIEELGVGRGSVRRVKVGEERRRHGGSCGGSGAGVANPKAGRLAHHSGPKEKDASGGMVRSRESSRNFLRRYMRRWTPGREKEEVLRYTGGGKKRDLNRGGDSALFYRKASG